MATPNEKAINNWLNAAVAPEDRKVLTAREVAEYDQALVAAGGDAELLDLAGGERAVAEATLARYGYRVRASYEDRNGQRCESNNAETLGEAYSRWYATEEEAEREAADLRKTVGRDVSATTEYTVEAAE